MKNGVQMGMILALTRARRQALAGFAASYCEFLAGRVVEIARHLAG